MKIKATLAAVALAMTPSLALAWGGCGTMKPEQTAASCTDGQVWDDASGNCVTPATS